VDQFSAWKTAGGEGVVQQGPVDQTIGWFCTGGAEADPVKYHTSQFLERYLFCPDQGFDV
jgi:hypothetical protein